MDTRKQSSQWARRLARLQGKRPPSFHWSISFKWFTHSILRPTPNRAFVTLPKIMAVLFLINAAAVVQAETLPVTTPYVFQFARNLNGPWFANGAEACVDYMAEYNKANNCAAAPASTFCSGTCSADPYPSNHFVWKLPNYFGVGASGLSGDGWFYARTACPAGYEPKGGTVCSLIPSAETFTITLDQKKVDLEPIGTAAPNVKTSQTFTATVTGSLNGAKAGAKVTIKADVKQSTGGHAHTDTLRPKGYLGNSLPVNLCDPNAAQPQACVTGTTNDKGQFSFTFTSPEVSGEHTITASCDVCKGNEDKADVTVKVDGLQPIPTSQFYALNEANGAVIGAVTGNHTDNHFLVPEASLVLWRIAAAFRLEKQFAFIDPDTKQQLVLHLNDASLVWGGVFDICAIPNECPDLGVIAWYEPHTEHRRGSVVDVRANNKPGAIPKALTRNFQLLARYYGADPHLEGGSTRHFHLRLLNRKE